MTSKRVHVIHEDRQTQVCTKCLKELPFSAFHKSSRKKHGRVWDCKVCRKNKQGEYRVRQAKEREETPDELRPTKKRCHRCQKDLDINQFTKNKYRKDGKNANCKRCNREIVLLREYGITYDEFRQMLLSQDNKCRICQISFKQAEPVVDHSHTTGDVRAALCFECNTMLGLGKESAVIFMRAATYIEEFENASSARSY